MRWLVWTVALVACGGGGGGTDSGDDGVEPLFIPEDGFYLVEYLNWDRSTCVVYPQDRLGAQVNVVFDGGRVNMDFDKKSLECHGDKATQTFFCDEARRSIGFKNKGLDATVHIFHTLLDGRWTDTQHFVGTEHIRIECEGDDADCLEAANRVPPFPWASQQLAYPCDTQSDLEAAWVEP